MARLDQKGDTGEVNGAGENIAPAWNQSAAKRRIEKILLHQLPGYDFAGTGLFGARLLGRSRSPLPWNMHRRRRAAHQQGGHALGATRFGLSRSSLRVKPVHDRVLHFVGVGENVALIEAQYIREVLDSGDVI